jgi:hypothetical protein
MLTITKEQVWQDLERSFARTVDGLGKRIDTGIMAVVVAFNAYGLSTSASCEGHLDHGCAYPWIDVRSSDPRVDEVRQEIAVLLSEGKKGSEEVEQLQIFIHQLNYQEELKLIAALDSFYQHHQSSYDQHLVFWHDITGGCRVQSQGAGSQNMRTPDEQLRRQQEYQAEMQVFADFLKRQFFGELLTQSEYTTIEAASLLGMEPQAVTRNIMRGNLVAQKHGRDYLITHAELERFMQERRGRGRPSQKGSTSTVAEEKELETV